jgi:hypothetical protein
MARAMFEVQTHEYGRPIVQHGPAAGLPDFPQHRWTRITPRPIGLERARALADAQDRHAVVCAWMTAGNIYDNGKQPAIPAGWLPADRV